MKYLVLLSLVLTSFGCAVQQYPHKHPLSAEHRQKISKVPVDLSPTQIGIGASWFRTDSSAATAQYGLVGALVGGIMDAIINAGPSGRATKAADEIGEVVTTEFLNNSVLEAFENNKASLQDGSLSIAIDGVYLDNTGSSDANERIKLRLTYQLAENASALRVLAYASLSSNALTYTSPYTFKSGKAPKAANGGPIYSNTFTYESDRLEVPVFSPELQQELIKQIKERYTDSNGQLPAAKSDDAKKMEKELEDANDSTLSKSEASIFLIRNWIDNNGQLAFQEIKKANEFILKQLAIDLNRTDVPSFQGNDDRILETHADGRVVRMIGAGLDAGSITSSAGNLSDFVTYGNATNYSRANLKNQKSTKKASSNGKKKKSKKRKKSSSDSK